MTRPLALLSLVLFGCSRSLTAEEASKNLAHAAPAKCVSSVCRLPEPGACK